MSLQDEHLKQALQSAPDRDLAPNDAVRQKVLDYAKSASSKNEGWFKKLLNRFNAWQVGSWQLIGISAIASIFLVIIMVRPQWPGDTVWEVSDVQDIAQAEDVESEMAVDETLESVAANSVPQTEMMSSKDAEVLMATDDDFTQLSKKSEVVQPRPKAITKTKKANSEPKTQATANFAEHKGVLDAAPISQPVTIDPAEADITEEVVLADKAGSALASRMEGRRAAAKPNVPARKRAFSSDEAIRGKTLAEKDIQGGNLRLLLLADATWPEGKALVDKETGFPVESVKNVAAEMTVVDVEAYNQTMRAWYNLNLNH